MYPYLHCQKSTIHMGTISLVKLLSLVISLMSNGNATGFLSKVFFFLFLPNQMQLLELRNSGFIRKAAQCFLLENNRIIFFSELLCIKSVFLFFISVQDYSTFYLRLLVYQSKARKCQFNWLRKHRCLSLAPRCYCS